jgi:tRNA-splicing ligase RtcB (3'-phosphate/5'-hydroxy nucleic acid ligase)
LPRVMDEVVKVISFGMGRANSERVNFADWPVFDKIDRAPLDWQRKMMPKAQSQFGTVGGGNHYVDLFCDSRTGHVWIGVHFGSRGFGHDTAQAFFSLAEGKDYDSRVPKGNMEAPPNYLSLGTRLGQDYMRAMSIAGDYAWQGREWVVGRLVKLLGAKVLDTVHNFHNYAWVEKHNEAQYLVTRKGATPAFPGQRGFIGGSMLDIAVIVEGVDSPLSAQSFYSTVHGAGRAMSRGEAKRKLNWAETLEAMKVAKIELRGAAVDESPGAYKRIGDVLAYHSETIKILHELLPIGVVMAGKGVDDPYKD